MGEPVGDVSDADKLDPDALGFMCGLEVHQQLATGKLHSRQAGELHDVTIETVPSDWPRVRRKLRVARGESGKIDVAAKFEARRNRQFVYVQSPNSGLIELDEQPPDIHDEDAVEVALTIAGLMNSHPVPLLQTMRKTVVDGSNTSGFQRTTLVATNGMIPTERGAVGVDVICLEEDSARKLDTQSGEDGELVTWNLDRLGIPLVEIATSPDIISPIHAQETAKIMGSILRDTRRVRRGLGSIRQDLNVSIACGDRVEIKGCQDLDWIPRIISLEMARQLHFYRLANTLREVLSMPLLPPDRRQTDASVELEIATKMNDIMPLDIHDAGDAFSSCESKMVKETIASGGVMLAVKLPHLAGHLGTKTPDSGGAQMPRLGRELASAAKLAGVAGIFHSDELPAYGITETEVDAVKAALAISDGDAFALCCAPRWQAELALESVINRARMAWHRIPQEVRNVVISKGAPADGTTTAMRPLPGGARMYPETDIPPLSLQQQTWKDIIENLPKSRGERENDLTGTGISADQIMQLLDREIDDDFHAGINGQLIVGLGPIPPKVWATSLLDTTRKSISETVGCAEERVPIETMAIALSVKEEGKMTREGLIPTCSDILTTGTWPLAGLTSADSTKSMRKEFASRAESLGFKPADTGDLAAIVEKVVSEREGLIAERGLGAMGPLMGVVMSEAGGSADGKTVSQLLKDAIQKRL